MADPNEALDAPDSGWYRSSFCEANGCVEIRIVDNNVAIRSSLDRQASVLTFSHAEWKAFLDGVYNHEFDLGIDLIR
jgi:hypothetical protein